MRHIRLCLLIVMIGMVVLPPTVEAENEDEQRIEFSGDFRGRLETFRFSEDETGDKKNRRSRLRYRFRLNASATINEHVSAAVRLTTGDTDSRSGNQTLGSPVDFGTNEIDVRRAYLTISPYRDGSLPGGRDGKWTFDFGRVPNPLLWKNGQDKMLWDSDIALAGLSTRFHIATAGAIKLSANAGYYVLDENSGGKDPYMLPGQIGIEGDVADGLSMGVRGTYYYFDQLDDAFIQRGVDGTGGVTDGGGNIPDGLTGKIDGGTMNVVEAQAFTKVSKAEKWPITVYGGFSNNMSAEASDSIPVAGKESKAFNVGGDVGDKKKVIRVGVALYYIEANAFPSQFIDSDFLDGRTNRKGMLLYFSRRIIKSTDFNIQGFLSDAIESNLTPASVAGSERHRWQFDLAVAF